MIKIWSRTVDTERVSQNHMTGEEDPNRPTMKDWLEEIQRLDWGTATGESAVEALHAVRREREEHLDNIWRRE